MKKNHIHSESANQILVALKQIDSDISLTRENLSNPIWAHCKAETQEQLERYLSAKEGLLVAYKAIRTIIDSESRP